MELYRLGWMLSLVQRLYNCASVFLLCVPARAVELSPTCHCFFVVGRGCMLVQQ